MARLTHWKQPAFSTEEPDTTMDMTFQIPEVGHATQLLGDDDFLNGMDDSFGSPQRSSQQHALAQPPLTLEELTPRKALKHNLRGALSTKIYAESTPFLKRDKFSPVCRTRAGQGEENVQPHDAMQAAEEVAPTGQTSRSTSPKRVLHPPARPKAQRLASNDDAGSSSPPENDPVVKSVHPDALFPAAESVETVQEAIRPEVTTASKAVDLESQNGPLTITAVPRANPESSRQRQHARIPSSLNTDAVNASKIAPANAARPNKAVSAPTKAVQQAPSRVRPKVSRPVGPADETRKFLQAEEKRAQTVAPQVVANGASPHLGSDLAALKTDTFGSCVGPSYVSRPSTPSPHVRGTSSPLTLSKLSPSKQAPDAVLASQPPAGAGRASSPVIATTLHPANPVLSAQPKGGQTSRQPPTGRALNDQPRSVLPSVRSTSTAGPSKAKAKPAVKVLAGKPQAKKQAAHRRSSVQRSYCVPSVAAKQKSAPRPGALTAKRRAGLQELEHAGTSARRREPGLASSSENKKPTQRLTKPIEFHFKVESRLSARKASDGQDAPKIAAAALRDPSIPDFAARHAFEAERVLARKERIAPTVPHSPEFTVEARLREREKYEEGRRAREAEIEQQREQERLQREREEEAELRRLRKLTVPKANAVPEWYAHAPKKTSSSTSGTV